MKNSEEVINKIKEIKNLDKEITEKDVEQDLEEATQAEDYKRFLESLIDEKIDFNSEETINKLIANYMNIAPYMGYCQKYWNVKKQVLKEKYNINWYTPTEENPGVIYD